MLKRTHTQFNSTDDLEATFIGQTASDLDQNIYRYMQLAHFEQLISKRQNVLVNPILWADPFENYVLNANLTCADGSHYASTSKPKIYAQCWTAKKASEAMWRIYSPPPYNQYIRIRTTPRKLLQCSTKAHTASSQDKFYFGKVKYVSDKALLEFGNTVFANGINSRAIAETLCIKRRAFAHENERRLLYITHSATASPDLMPLKVSPLNLIDQVMIDPRLDRNQSLELKRHIIHKARFPGTVLRSLIYHKPKGLTFTVGATVQ